MRASFPALCLAAALSVVCTDLYAQDEELSRGELLTVLQTLTPDFQQYALPSTFSFPSSARAKSIFGVDSSHHVEDKCKCQVDWAAAAAKKIQFVYLKATQGSSYVDPTWKRNADAIHKASIDFGLYHFTTASANINSQVTSFLSQYRSANHQGLVPAIDIEWDAGPLTKDCPSDAIITVKRSDGTQKSYCDEWSSIKSSEIISRLNIFIDALKLETGKDPILYTNSSWWGARVGQQNTANLHDVKFWLADYSKSGLATEDPRRVAKRPWHLWQFSESAKIDGMNGVRIDTSIVGVTQSEFSADVHLN